MRLTTEDFFAKITRLARDHCVFLLWKGRNSMFGNKNKEEKAAQDVAVSAEIERLISLPVADLAAEMMPAFGPDGPRVPGGGVGILQVLSWLMSSYPRGNKNLSRLLPAGREGIQALERAGLVQILHRGEDGSAGRLNVTRLGQAALAGDSVRQHLARPS